MNCAFSAADKTAEDVFKDSTLLTVDEIGIYSTAAEIAPPISLRKLRSDVAIPKTLRSTSV